jgi:hypothetical protein
MAKDDHFGSLLTRAQASLSVDASEKAVGAIKSSLERVASELVLEWIVGERRFESPSQQTEDWIAFFYERLFFDEQPDAVRIYERFGLSLARANYIARSLRARRVAQWRNAAQKELAIQLQRHVAGAREAQKENQGHIQEFDVSLSPGAADELRVVYDRVSQFVAERERPKPPRPKPSFGNSRWVGVPADTLLLIMEALNKESKK